jgi:hypothetical protein
MPATPAKRSTWASASKLLLLLLLLLPRVS